jgi:hypothetical protein
LKHDGILPQNLLLAERVATGEQGSV